MRRTIDRLLPALVLVRIVGEMNGGTESATLEAAEGN